MTVPAESPERAAARLVALMAALVIGTAAMVVIVPRSGSSLARDVARDTARASVVTQPLSELVASWPTAYTVTGTKSEPGYIEHITLTRDGDLFGLRIVIAAQGEAAGGSSTALVRVASDGRIQWLSGCTADDCANDTALRGYLGGAAMLSAQRQGRLTATATIRYLDSRAVACVADHDLYLQTSPTTSSTASSAVSPALAPCFSMTTGAVLGQYSDVNATFDGPTMAAGSIVETRVSDADLITVPPGL